MLSKYPLGKPYILTPSFACCDKNSDFSLKRVPAGAGTGMHPGNVKGFMLSYACLLVCYKAFYGSTRVAVEAGHGSGRGMRQE